jgi:hypothetical protein
MRLGEAATAVADQAVAVALATQSLCFRPPCSVHFQSERGVTQQSQDVEEPFVRTAAFAACSRGHENERTAASVDVLTPVRTLEQYTCTRGYKQVLPSVEIHVSLCG